MDKTSMAPSRLVLAPSADLPRIALVRRRCFHTALTSLERCKESMPGWWRSRSPQNRLASVADSVVSVE